MSETSYDVERLAYLQDKRRERLEKALRELVATMFNDLVGAYGASDGRCYEGQYNKEIHNIVYTIF